MKRYLIFLPSTALGLIALIWLYFRPIPYSPKIGFFGMLMVAALVIGGLLGSAHLLEKYLASFRHASKLLERSLGHFKISLVFAFGLAALSAISEELFFRGALMPIVTVWGQAILFGLMHPAPKKAWSYTVFTAFAGLVFGFATLYSGSLIPGIVAHFIINLQGFLEIRALQKKRTRITFPTSINKTE